MGGSVEIINTSVLAGRESMAFDFEGADIRGLVLIRRGTLVRGGLYFNKARLGAGLYATVGPIDVSFANPGVLVGTRHLLVDGRWDMSFAEVRGPVLLHGVSLCGRFVARHLTVHGDLDLCGSVIGAPTEAAAFALRILFAFAMYWPKPLPLWWFKFEYVRPVTPPPDDTPDQLVAHRAVDLELAEIHGRLWVKRSRVLGTTYLEDATVAGEANFDGTDVRGDLILRSAEIKGQVFADEREGASAYPRVSGCVDLSFATVQQVDVKFDRTAAAVTPEYLDLTGATVDSLRLSGTVAAKEPPFVVAEGMRFGTLDCDGLTVRGEPPQVSWYDVARFTFWLTLAATALTLTVQHGSWLVWVIGSYAIATSAAAALAWRRKQKGPPAAAPRGLLDHLGLTYPFSRGYYVLVERKLREAGNDADADEVFHMRRRRERRGPKEPAALPARMREVNLVERWSSGGLATRAWLWFLDFLMGFGVRPGRLVHLYVVLGLLNAAVFLDPASVERPVAYVQYRTDSPQWGWTNPKPSGGNKSESPRWNGPGFGPADGNSWLRMPENPWPSDGGMPDAEGEDGWSTGHAVFMALRVQVPVLTLVAENDWSPATRPACRLFSYADYASIMMVLNLILIPLIVAGLTGYLKK